MLEWIHFYIIRVGSNFCLVGKISVGECIGNVLEMGMELLPGEQGKGEQ